MKEKIEALSQGKFEYKLPDLYLSKKEIRIEVIAGQVYEDFITVTNSINRRMKGVVYSSNSLLTLPENNFVGKTFTIHYRFNASFLKAGDEVKGELTIVSDCGEYGIPFSAKVLAPYIMTSIGKLENLNYFANLARRDWAEAMKVFRSENFEKIVISENNNYYTTYMNLIKNMSTSQALEEFLILIKKKNKINISLNKNKLEYDIFSDEKINGSLTLSKDGWGYGEIRLSTDVPYIKLMQKRLWTDRFIDNKFQLSFLIVPEEMGKGKNYGRIFIKTISQTIVVNVICHKKADEEEEKHLLLRKKTKKIDLQMTKNYLDFQLNNINPNTYVSRMSTLLDSRYREEGSYIPKLMQIHLALLSGREEEAGRILEELSGTEKEIGERSYLEYCGYLYLLALHRKDEENIEYAKKIIRAFYTSGNPDWRLLWFLLYLDKSYDIKKELKIEHIKEQFDRGCTSPVLYHEAVLVYNEEPFLLRELGEFEIQVMNYGIENKMLTKDSIVQYTYLTARMKNFHPLIFKGLTSLYEEDKREEILSSICSMLIKGLKRSNRYHKWFKLGVEAHLRITGMYEYYIYSIDNNTDHPLDEPVLLYFIYNSNISNRKKAFLYANVIKNKSVNQEIYQSYLKKMKLFALKQLEVYEINKDLALLYEEFFCHKEVMTKDIADHLSQVCFTYQLSCDNPNIVSVTVYHRELEEEKTTSLEDGKALITIYSDNAQIFFTDSYGNKHKLYIKYTIYPLLDIKKCVDIIGPYSENPLLVLYLYNSYGKNHVVTEESISIREKLLSLDNLKDYYRSECLISLIDYYYKNCINDSLDRWLNELDIELVGSKERIKVFEYLIARGIYSKAKKMLKDFHFQDIKIKSLVDLSSGLLEGSKVDIEKDEDLLNLCHYLYQSGKEKKDILAYLIRFYYGPTKDMLSIWNGAKASQMETSRFEKRILSASLFAESNLRDTYQVFIDFCKDDKKNEIIKAYLIYNAYRYLVHDTPINKELLKIMREELNYGSNDFYLLAWLKYNSTNDQLTEEENTFIEISIVNLEKKGIVLPFFLKYKKHIDLPGRLLDKSFVEYKADPDKQVYIHYRLISSERDEYITELMVNVFNGIHLKEFVLFYNDPIQYYITEIEDGEENITETFTLQYDKDMPVEANSRYNQINIMLKAIESQDDETLLEIMEQYVMSEYIINKCFHPL